MSAFLVSKKHIDAMVGLAWQGPKGSNSHTWYGPHWGRNPLGARVNDLMLDKLGRELWQENLNSIHARYPDTRESGHYPAANDFAIEQIASYDFPIVTFPRVTAVEGLKIIHCYEYQSCEHDDWDTSDAKAFCDELARSLESCLPGYDEAPWGI